MQRATIKNLFWLLGATLGVTILVWLPFLLHLQIYGLDFRQGLTTIYRNFDGVDYIIIAKSLYNPQLIAKLPQSLSANYYAAHFPGYALAILGLSPLLGFLKSMLLVAIIFTIASVWMFYLMLHHFKLTDHPLWLSLIFLILPARWLVVHSVGSAEPMFIFAVLASIYCFMRYELEKKNWWIWSCAFFGLLAQITRPPGLLLLLSFGLYLLIEKVIKPRSFKNLGVTLIDYLPLILIPLTLLAIFYWFSLSYGDFWAYFKSGDNIHLTFPPYQVFNKNQFWVGEIWLEDIVYIFILGFLGVTYLFKRKLLPMAYFGLVYLLATIFVTHRDVSRYALPVIPFILIAFEKVLVSKEFRIVLIIVSLAIYLYAQNFILANTAPIANLSWFN